MQIPTIVFVLAISAGVIILGLVLFLWWRSRQIDLTGDASGEKPPWMQTTPPPETQAVTSTGMYGQDDGEQIAAPFAEQIEDILATLLRQDAALSSLKVDLGSDPDGGLVIWVDGVRYDDVADIPNPQLQQAFAEAVRRWQNA